MSSTDRNPTDPSSDTPPAPTTSKPSKPQWLLWALGSGAFAATNGVFAKLTTADTTHHLSARLFASSALAEYALRALFFGLNLLSNAIMWILFTRALTAASSTTRVSVLNTSANFLVTAVYGFVVFGEGVGWEWGVGAAMLVAGCVVIGRREEVEEGKKEGAEGEVGGGAIRLSGEERRLDGGRREEEEGQQQEEVTRGGRQERGKDAVEEDEEDEAQVESRKEREVWEERD